MRKLIMCILLLTFLLQSCYSYKVIDIKSNLAVGEKYKIKLSNKFEKIRLVSSTDSTITINNNKKVEVIISKNDIKSIKKRQFSITKTILFPIGIVVTTIGLGVAIILSDRNFPLFKE